MTPTEQAKTRPAVEFVERERDAIRSMSAQEQAALLEEMYWLVTRAARIEFMAYRDGRPAQLMAANSRRAALSEEGE